MPMTETGMKYERDFRSMGLFSGTGILFFPPKKTWQVALRTAIVLSKHGGVVKMEPNG